MPCLAVAVLCTTSAIAACSSKSPAPPVAGDDGSSVETAREVERQPAPPDATPSEAREETDQPPESPAPSPVDIYDPTTIPKFELTLDAAAIATLAGSTKYDKPWVHGAIKFGAITFADVGVRSKGSATLRALPDKASLKVKFNKWVKGQKLWGLEEITLNNMVADRNFLRQRLTYHVFRSMGLPASRANTSQLTINGEDYGIYANIETPDDTFLERVFGKNVRTLYEAHTPGTWLPGSDGGWEIDVPAPDAPPNTKPDLNRLFQAVAASKDETLLADLEPYLHTKDWLRFSATEAIVGHYDGYAYSFYVSHNYFLAGDIDGRFTMLPWSTDTTMTDAFGIADASKPQRDVVLTRCARSKTCWDAYKAEVRSVLAVYETLDLVRLAHEWHDQIDALVRADPKREVSIGSYEQETDALYKWLTARPGVVRTQLGL